MSHLPSPPRRLIVGISGASGSVYGIRALQVLRLLGGVQTHLVLSTAARRTLSEETDWTVEAVEALADVVHAPKDIGASIASGSFQTAGMLVAPCSIKTLSAVAHCYADNLLTRAADVCLKERRPLVLMVRETPLHLGHLELMAAAARSGAIIAPPVPAFYSRPQTLDDLVDQAVGKALDLLGIAHDLLPRWGESRPGAADAASDPHR